MTMAPEQIDPEIVIEAPSGPGRSLADARKAANLTLIDVAARLHLDTRTVDALERDDYSRLPSPAFVRGYLRSYARLLSLPPEPIVNAYNQRGFAPPALIPDIGYGTQAQAESSDLLVRIGTYLIAAVLVALVVVWWRSHMANPFSVLGGTSSTPSEAVAAPEGTAGANTLGADPANPLTVQREPRGSDPSTVAALAAPLADPAGGEIALMEPGASGLAVDSPATRATSASPAVDPAVTDSETAGEQSAVPPSVGTATADASTTTAPAGTPPPDANPVADAASVTPAGNGTGSLRLSFRYDCWVEVHSPDGRRVYFGMARAGQALDLHGQTPLRVLLGNVRDVRVEYNGRLIDFSPFINRGIARFTVDESGISGDATAATQ